LSSSDNPNKSLSSIFSSKSIQSYEFVPRSKNIIKPEKSTHSDTSSLASISNIVKVKPYVPRSNNLPLSLSLSPTKNSEKLEVSQNIIPPDSITTVTPNPASLFPSFSTSNIPPNFDQSLPAVMREQSLNSIFLSQSPGNLILSQTPIFPQIVGIGNFPNPYNLHVIPQNYHNNYPPHQLQSGFNNNPISSNNIQYSPQNNNRKFNYSTPKSFRNDSRKAEDISSKEGLFVLFVNIYKN
jgi:hypothetical protein